MLLIIETQTLLLTYTFVSLLSFGQVMQGTKAFAESKVLQLLRDWLCKVVLELRRYSKSHRPASLFLLWLQVLFALHDATLLSGMQLAGVTTKNIEPLHTGSSKLDIFLELYEAPNGSVVGQIEYDSSLWKRSSINAMAASFLVRPELMSDLIALHCEYAHEHSQ